MANVKWIKIATDIFENDKFDAIEALPDGLMIELVWLKLLCLAGKCNRGGMLIIADEIPYTDEMLASRFHMEIGVVQRAIEQFERLKMIEVIDSAYLVSNWSRYQSEDRLERIREKDRERKKLEREERKVHGLSTDSSDGNALISISLNSNSLSEEDRGVGEEETEDEYKDSIIEIVDYMNKVCGTRYMAKTQTTSENIRARLKEGYTIGDCKYVIDVKAAEWKDNPKMRQYLRPITLFAPSKFAGYLNQQMPENTDDDFLKGFV